MSPSDDGEYEFLFRCPHCSRFSIGVYKVVQNGNPPFRFIRSLPSSPIVREFALIDMVSNRFTLLFNQSSAAESYGLSEIAGTGYRKALEFLVKDFCIALDPQQRYIIAKKFLKNVIDDHVPEGKLRTAATFTAWLGNDEGHYERRWVETDLQDLKALLELTIAFVAEEVQLEQYVRRMKPDQPEKLTFLLGHPSQ